MKFFALALAACVSLTGCETMAPTAPMYVIDAAFDANHAKALLADGRNTVRGNAFQRQRGGGVVTCAGQTVYLVPATAYAKLRITRLYGSGESAAVGRGIVPVFSPDPPEYRALVRSTRCDAQGNFEFDRVADGEFFVQTQVSWEVGSSPQGAALMHRVSVRGGQLVNLVMA